MKLSKSKYCNLMQCKKMLWLDENKPLEKEEIDNEAIMDNGHEVGELAKEIFGNHIDIKFNENLNIMIKDTKNALKNNNVIITEASFKYKDNFASIDILKKDNDEYEIYEVKSSTKVKDIFYHDISYQLYILNNLNLKVTKCFIVYLNKDYIRKGKLDLEKLFIKEDVTDKVYLMLDNINKNIKDIEGYFKNPYNIDISENCFKPYKCSYFKYCIKNLPENNVFNLRRISNKEKIKLYKNGIVSYEQLLKEDLNEKYLMQIDFDLNNKKDYIDDKKIGEFLNSLYYPLYFLDFETFQMSIPKYDNIKPYMQVPFQYSLHYYEDEKEILNHKEFLAKEGIDPRRSLAESLVKDIKKGSCVLAYNMSFEKSVIKNLAELYEDLKEDLMNIYDNIKDLMIPFYNREYYSKNMHGSYSIKYVLPALFPYDKELDYHNLDLIHNGSEAMNAFSTLEEKNKEEIEIIRKNLLKYCKLDTFAMVKIYEKLKEVTK